MTAYDALASRYDALTGDVQYEKRADFIEKLFHRSRIPVHTVLDLACGTGTMTWILTARGYELIAVDNSEDMLAAAMRKSGAVEGIAPIFLHQSMPKLDLYGGRRRGLLPGQSQLPDPPCRRAAHLSAAAPVHRPRRAAGVRRKHRGKAVVTGRSGVSG